jgi:membrane protease subunit HflK
MAELTSNDRIGGRVSEIINQARSYRTMIVAQVRSEADTFRQLLPTYQDSPELVRERLWRDTRERILSGDVETFYLPDDSNKTMLLEFNRDPAVKRRREQQRLMQQTDGNSSTTTNTP